MSSDSAVVFENSPLARYLAEVGLSDGIDMVPLQAELDGAGPAVHPPEAADAEGLKRSSVRASSAPGWLGWLAELCPVEGTALRALLRIDRAAAPYGVWAEEYIDIAGTAMLLEPDDAHLLRSVCVTIAETEAADDPDAAPRWQRRPVRHGFVAEWLPTAFVAVAAMCRATTAVAALAAAHPVSMLQGARESPTAYIAAGLLLLSDLKSVADIVSISAQLRVHLANIDRLAQWARRQRELDVAVDDGVRLLQEIELIARGFCVSSGHLPPISRIEQATDRRLCVPVRQRIYAGLLRCLVRSREGTVDMVTLRPLTEGLDYTGLYIANSSLGHLGVCGDDDANALSRATGSLSLTSLKTLIAVHQQQRSEWLRRFCLSVLEECEPRAEERADAGANSGGSWAEEPPRSLSVAQMFGATVGVIDYQLAAVQPAAAAIAKEVSFHLQFTTVPESSDGEGGRSRAPERTEVDSEFVPFVHYRQAVGQLGRTLQTAVAAAHLCLPSAGDVTAAPTAAAPGPALHEPADPVECGRDLAVVRNAIEQARRHLEFAESCLAAAVAGDAVDTEDTADAEEDTAAAASASAAAAADEIGTSTATPRSDPGPPRDQWFEAYTGPEDDGSELLGLSPEERKALRDAERKKRQAARKKQEAAEAVAMAEWERTAGMMSELKSVLAKGGVR